MKTVHHIAASFCCFALLAAEPHQAGITNAPSQRGAHGTAGPKTVEDDLAWLVGRWRCVSRQFLSPAREGLKHPDLPLGWNTPDFLEYFNVYLPYADDQPTLLLSADPEERPIAAEFLVRKVEVTPVFEERLVAMSPRGIVRIGTDRIRVGTPFDNLEFKYRLVQGEFSHTLSLETKYTRLVLEKLSSSPGDLLQSHVIAPIREYPEEKVRAIAEQYTKLRTGVKD